jgi:hypothetical protein
MSVTAFPKAPRPRARGPVLGRPPYFVKCAACGQLCDQRDLRQVYHHELVKHAPIPPRLVYDTCRPHEAAVRSIFGTGSSS